MQVSFTSALQDSRACRSMGRVRAVGRWSAAETGCSAELRAAVRALVREAEEYGADALVDVSFEVDEVRAADIGVPLHRVVATGTAVHLALAA
jgi:uncharacterized protein YbjQ (UPF0145 family)